MTFFSSTYNKGVSLVLVLHCQEINELEGDRVGG